MFSSCNPKFFAIRHIHYPVKPSSDHLLTDAVVPSSDNFRTDAVLPPSDHNCIDTVAPPGDHYGIDIVVPSSDNCCTDTVPPFGDHYGSKIGVKCVTCSGLHILEKDNSEINHSCVSSRLGCMTYLKSM